MATLDDKLMGEKLQYYCSSSEDEKDDGGSGDEEDGARKMGGGKAPVVVTPASNELSNDMTHWQGNSANTGPKGVIKDWQRFKQLENEKKEEQEREKLELMKKLSITAKTSAEDKKAKEQDEFDQELEELLNDEFLQEFQKRRMQEMLALAGRLPNFGQVITLKDCDEFLNAIDKEPKNVTVFVHIYEDKYKACKTMNKCLDKLAQEYASVKFCKILSTVAGLSIKFKTTALPTLLVYKSGQVIGNFIRMGEEFGDEFYPSDVESFLIEHAMLPDKTLMPTITSSATANTNNDDDDE